MIWLLTRLQMNVGSTVAQGHVEQFLPLSGNLHFLHCRSITTSFTIELSQPHSIHQAKVETGILEPQAQKTSPISQSSQHQPGNAIITYQQQQGFMKEFFLLAPRDRPQLVNLLWQQGQLILTSHAFQDHIFLCRLFLEDSI